MKSNYIQSQGQIIMHKENPDQSENQMHNRLRHLMPQDEASQRILKERAMRLAKSTVMKQEDREIERYLQFYLDENNQYGILYKNLKEVLKEVTITQVPFTKEFIAGVINYRGMLYPVLDLAVFFGIGNSKSGQVIMVAANGMTIGVLVNRIIGETMFHRESLALPLNVEDKAKSDFIIGLDGGSIAIINMDSVLTASALQTVT